MVFESPSISALFSSLPSWYVFLPILPYCVHKQAHTPRKATISADKPTGGSTCRGTHQTETGTILQPRTPQRNTIRSRAFINAEQQAHRRLDKEVQGEDADAGRQEPPPEHGGGIKGGALLYGEQQTTDGRCKGSGHACVHARQ